MKFKDIYMHYIWCEVKTEMGVFKLLARIDNEWVLDTIAYGAGAVEQNIKPILRKLEDMTEEDAIQGKWHSREHFIEFMETHRYGQRQTQMWYASDYNYLCSKGYDLFGLIDSSEALDAKTVKK